VNGHGNLFLLFPGTQGQPRDYRKLCDQAADLGFHAICLRYPNDVAINELAGGDLSLHRDLRLDHWDGGHRTGKVALAKADTIAQRLDKLLGHLQTMEPQKGWEQYRTGETIDWTRVTVAGHSLGGGYAALVAQREPVARLLALAWSDWDRSQGNLAHWIAESDWATPPERRFFLFHERDEMVPVAVAQRTASVLGFGPQRVRVESEEPPYQRARVLWTDLDPSRQYPTAAPCHNSVALDVEMPYFWDNTPALADAWTWMLTGSVLPVA
jgi:dienelactone hydrolase